MKELKLLIQQILQKKKTREQDGEPTYSDDDGMYVLDGIMPHSMYTLDSLLYLDAYQSNTLKSPLLLLFMQS